MTYNFDEIRNTVLNTIEELDTLARAKKIVPQAELDNRCKNIGELIGRLPASERSGLGIKFEAAKLSLMTLIGP